MRNLFRRPQILPVAAAVSLLTACGGSPTKPLPQEPEGVIDSLARDGGESDAGSIETGPDAGMDAGMVVVDAGIPEKVGPIVDLRADNNRDGVVDLVSEADDKDEETWDATHGAIFLANLDDDGARCAYTGDTESSDKRSDTTLAACSDANDTIVNGASDLLDMAPLHIAPWKKAPDGATATLKVSFGATKYVRLFKKGAMDFVVFDPTKETFTAKDLREGVELRLEGLDIVRNATTWDGYVDVTLNVKAPAVGTEPAVDESDVVRLRVAPVLLSHHLLAAEQFTVSKVAFNGQLDPDYVVFRTDLEALLAPLNPPKPLYAWGTDDPWNQDYFENGVSTMPSANGQHVMRYFIRSANSEGGTRLRTAGRIIYKFRGPDVAAIHQADTLGGEDDSMNSFGNTETVPPYTLDGVSYPLGRIYRGKTATRFPDKSFQKMLEDQKVQPPIYVDTAWLAVGHVDETLSFVKANTPRGWAVVVSDPQMAIDMLLDAKANGKGSAKLFNGKRLAPVFGGGTGASAERTVDQVLQLPTAGGADTVRSYSVFAASKIEGQLAVLKKETGITEADVVRIPVLFEEDSGDGIAYNPGQANGLYGRGDTFIAPDTFGPVIDGKDIYKVATESALAKIGVTVKWIDDWDTYHLWMGEVHCGTNTVRAAPSTKWWETGR